MVPEHVSDALNRGLAAHRAGKLGEARRQYERVILANPRNVEAIKLLAIALAGLGDHPRATEMFRKVVALQPGVAEGHFNLGLELQGQGQEALAADAFRSACALQPSYADAWTGLGLSLEKRADTEAAAQAYEQAARLDPTRLGALLRLADAVLASGNPTAAAALYRRAIAVKPSCAEAHGLLGNAQRQAGQLKEAARSYQEALVHEPRSAPLLNNLGIVLQEQGLLDEAVAAFQGAIAADPTYAEAHNSLAPALQRLNRPEEAIGACKKALALQPSLGAAWSNLGNALLALNRLAEATEAFGEAVRLSPKDSMFLKNLGHAHLAAGRLREGWPLYEERWKTGPKESLRGFTQPQWTGASDLRGKTLLLHAEQGLGDTLQFARFVALLADRGARVILEVQPALRELLDSTQGAWRVIARGEPLPAFDLHCPLLSVPLALGTDLGSIPAPQRYVRADPQKAAQWRSLLAEDTPGLRVGLVWSGQPLHGNDHNRSMALSLLGPLVSGAKERFVCLQNEVRASDRPALSGLREIMNPSAELRTFADTAALVEALDLVITVDTSVAHLAGSMGKRVWVLLPFAADWRWMCEREDSPWYPSARLYRQPSIGDWAAVVRRLRSDLDALQARR